MLTEPWQDALSERLAAEFAEWRLQFLSYHGQRFLIAPPPSLPPLLRFLKTEEEFDYLVDLTAVDYPNREKRFELVYILYSFSRNERIRIKAEIAEGERPQSSAAIYPGANWLEREVFDMFGVRFAGHPDLKRILLPDEWTGHPLRKDYSINQMDNRWVRENLGIDSGQ